MLDFLSLAAMLVRKFGKICDAPVRSLDRRSDRRKCLSHGANPRREISDMLLGYARVSTEGQSLGAQQVALTEAGCAKLFVEKASGAHARPHSAR